MLVLARDVLPCVAVLVLANRDENPGRPAEGARLRKLSRPGGLWLGGLDRLAGGTWLGLNDRGLVVAVTNRPLVSPPPPAPSDQATDAATRSRGLLCRDLLECTSFAEADERAWELLARDRYAGLNLLIATRSDQLVIEAVGEPRRVDCAGPVVCLGNGPPDDPADARLTAARAAVIEASEASGLQEVCAGHDADDPSRSACRHASERSTVSSAIIALGREPVHDEVYWSDGPPCTAGFHDLSPLAAQLAAGPVGPDGADTP